MSGEPIRAANVVCLTSQDPNNYEAVSFLRGFAEQELKAIGCRSTIVSGNQPMPTRFDGLEQAMQSADLLIVFVRRATPPGEQLELIRRHLEAGKPVVGIRTANHAFVQLPGSDLPVGCDQWPEFVPEVLGCQNTGYETQGLPYRVELHPSANSESELLEGVDIPSIRGYTSLYRVLPLSEDSGALLIGIAQGIEPAQPIAWTRTYGKNKARVFYTSLGDPQDMQQASVRRLLKNACRWALEGPKK